MFNATIAANSTKINTNKDSIASNNFAILTNSAGLIGLNVVASSMISSAGLDVFLNIQNQ